MKTTNLKQKSKYKNIENSTPKITCVTINSDWDVGNSADKTTSNHAGEKI
jgi:hypothetical protein